MEPVLYYEGKNIGKAASLVAPKPKMGFLLLKCPLLCQEIFPNITHMAAEMLGNDSLIYLRKNIRSRVWAISPLKTAMIPTTVG